MPAYCCIPFIAGPLLEDMTWASWTSRVCKHSVNQNLQLRLTSGQVRFWSVKSRNEFITALSKTLFLKTTWKCWGVFYSSLICQTVETSSCKGSLLINICIFFFPLSLEIRMGWVSAGSNLWLTKVQGTRSGMLLHGIQLNKLVIIKTGLKIQTLHTWSIVLGRLLRLTCFSLLFPIGDACVKSLLDTAVNWFTGGMESGGCNGLQSTVSYVLMNCQ